MGPRTSIVNDDECAGGRSGEREGGAGDGCTAHSRSTASRDSASLGITERGRRRRRTGERRKEGSIRRDSGLAGEAASLSALFSAMRSLDTHFAHEHDPQIHSGRRKGVRERRDPILNSNSSPSTKRKVLSFRISSWEIMSKTLGGNSIGFLTA